MGLLLSRADSLPEALQGALDELQRLWHARRVIAVTWTGADQPSVTVHRPGRRLDGPARRAPRDASAALRQRPLLTPTDGTSPDVGHHARAPGGRSWRSGSTPDPAPAVHAPRTGRCSPCCAGTSARRCTGPTRPISSGRPPWPCSGPSSARPGCRPGFAARYEPASRPLEVGGDWYDLVELPDGRIGIVVGDCVGHGLERGDRDGPAAQRLPGPAAAGRQPGADPVRHGPVRGARPGRLLQHGVLRHPRPGDRAS